jgi:Secretion system C-terminal sorting domain
MKILMKGFKTIFKPLATLLLLSVFGQASAQDSCTFRIRLFDRYGDGWDDSQLYVRTGTNAERAFTHNGASGKDTDSIRLYNIRVKTGDTIVVRYEPQGASQNEIRFALFNNAGEQFFAAGPTPPSGIVYKGRVKCVSCGSPSNFRVNSVRAVTTTVQWDPPLVGFQPTYRIEWDSVAFTPGSGAAKNSGTTTDTFAILPGLTEITKYFAYVRTTCNPATDTSAWIGPISFRTDTATNVGISAIVGPIGRCDLTIDSVRVKIKNYGGAPIALIPFTYSVNGIKAPVTMPTDGLYTGVISKDSTATIAFKAIYNFSLPGEYNIAAWTEVKADKNKRNDTFRLTVVRPRQISALPYTQDFENGKDTWQKVDDIGNSTWEWATPRYRFIQGAAGGSKCWSTSADSSYRDSDTSYLLSPCFDFSTQTADPRINFALNFYTEPRYDGAWLEGSTDGGKIWAKIGSRNSGGLNWYNDTLLRTNFELWTGINRTGWKTANHTLTGMGGKQDVRLRFAFKSDNATNVNYDGVAIDNIVVAAAQAVDLAMDSIGRVDLSDCGSLKDTVLLRLFNYGNTAQSTYSVSYRIDNNAVVTEDVRTVNVLPGKSAIYKFQSTANTLLATGTHTIKAWVNNSADNIRLNDTTTTTFIISPPIRGNTVFNFNTLPPPPYWSYIRADLGLGGHGNAPNNGYGFAKIFKDIATPNSNLFDATTNKFGPIRTDDTIKFDYRFVIETSPFNAYDLTNNDTLRVMVAKECDNNWVEIDKIFRSNHTPTSLYRTRSLSLKQFAGQIVKIRLQVTSEINTFVGYYVDFDNFIYQSICPTSFGTTANVKKAGINQTNGSIAVKTTRGVAPFTYKWNDPANSTKDSIANLAIGEYTVSITDTNGCTDVQTFKVDFVSSTFEAGSAISKVTLHPNPTSENAILNVELSKITDARVQIINLVGQVLSEQTSRQTDKAQFELDLSGRPAGIYLVRITADNKTHLARLVKQ